MNPVQTLKKREENAQVRRREILHQALQAFASCGFHGADVQVIADRAKVGKGTVYRHFGNKEKLFLATARWCVEELGDFAADRLGGELASAEIASTCGVAELLRRIAVACAEFYQQRPQAVEMMIMERAEFRESIYPTHLIYRAETRVGLETLIAEAMTSGEFRTLDSSQVLDAYADLLFGNIVNGCIGGAKDKLLDRIRQSVEIFVSGLVAKE